MNARTIAIGDIVTSTAALSPCGRSSKRSSRRPTTWSSRWATTIDRGNDTRSVIDQLLALKGRCRLVPLLGNHEEMLLAARTDQWALEFWLACGSEATLESYGVDMRLSSIPREHWQFLEGCTKFYETETHVFIYAREWFACLPTSR